MLQPSFTKRFEKDLALIKKRNKKLSKLKNIMNILIQEDVLPLKNKNHALIGNYIGRYECHIEPDWLLIYKLSNGKIIFERTGTHSDLF